jgi:hypothetical protein
VHYTCGTVRRLHLILPVQSIDLLTGTNLHSFYAQQLFSKAGIHLCYCMIPTNSTGHLLEKLILRSARPEIPGILWNPKDHCRVHDSPPQYLFRARWIRSAPSNPITLRSILVQSSHLRLGIPKASFLQASNQSLVPASHIPHALHVPISSSFIWSS